MQGSGLQLYLKRDSGTDVFLWSLQNLQNTSVGCFFIFYFEIFNIWVEYQINMFCALMFLSYVKSSISSMINNDSNTSSDNSELERKLPDFNILKRFKMEWISNINPRTSLANRYLIIAAGPNVVVFKTMDKVILPTIIFRVQTTINGLFQHTSGAWTYFLHPPGIIPLSVLISF